MFLNYLNNEEKNIFCKLASRIAYSDGKIDSKENELFDLYNAEMNTTFEFGEVSDLEISKSLLSLKQADDKIRRIVYLELLSLAKIDNDFSKEEKTELEKYRVSLDITEEENRLIENVIEELIAVYAKIRSLILNGKKI